MRFMAGSVRWTAPDTNRYCARMSRPEKSLRQQLLDARRDVERQIEILEGKPVSMVPAELPMDNSGLIANLRNTLREIDDGLANLGQADA